MFTFKFFLDYIYPMLQLVAIVGVIAIYNVYVEMIACFKNSAEYLFKRCWYMNEEYRIREMVAHFKEGMIQLVIFVTVVASFLCVIIFGNDHYENVTLHVGGVYAKVISIEKVIEVKGRDHCKIYIAKTDIGYGNVREATLELSECNEAVQVGSVVLIHKGKDNCYVMTNRPGIREEEIIIRPDISGWI